MNAAILKSGPPRSATECALGVGKQLKVGGLTAFTATDYPGRLSAVVFVQGCPWRCGYCHNPHLQPRLAGNLPEWPDVREFLKRRVGLIDAVVFSGGEPMVEPALAGAMREMRDLGFEIGLHSGGIYPERLAEVLPLADWIGLDVKAPFDTRYARVTGIAGSDVPALASAVRVIASGIDYEIRTTIHPHLLSESDILELAHSLARMGVKRYALQVFRGVGCGDRSLSEAALNGYPSSALIRELSAQFHEFELRRHF